MKLSRDAVWILLVLVVAASGVEFFQSPYDVVPSIPKELILRVDGICLGDSRSTVERVAGKQNLGKSGVDGDVLNFGLLDPVSGCIASTATKKGRVVAVDGIMLTDENRRPLLKKGSSEREVWHLLGKRNWVQFSGCGNDPNERYFFKQWKLIVLVDRKTRCANGFRLASDFPTEPSDGEINIWN